MSFASSTSFRTTKFLLTLCLGASCSGLLTGCARDGVLDVEIVIDRGFFPQAEFVRVEVVRSTGLDDDVLSGVAAETIALDSLAETTYSLSIVSDAEPEAVVLRILSCRSRACDHPGSADTAADPQHELRSRIEHPIYSGERTSLQLELNGEIVDWQGETSSMLTRCNVLERPPARPYWACEVDKCQLQGCGSIDVGSPSLFCRPDERHFCE